MSEEFTPLDEQEIIQILYENLGDSMYLKNNDLEFIYLTSEQFQITIKKNVQISNETKNELFSEGADCKVMKFGAKGWQKGKIRVKMTVEFCPDEPEEPEILEKSQAGKSDSDSLDDLRKELNQ